GGGDTPTGEKEDHGGGGALSQRALFALKLGLQNQTRRNWQTAHFDLGCSRLNLRLSPLIGLIRKRRQPQRLHPCRHLDKVWKNAGVSILVNSKCRNQFDVSHLKLGP